MLSILKAPVFFLLAIILFLPNISTTWRPRVGLDCQRLCFTLTLWDICRYLMLNFLNHSGNDSPLWNHIIIYYYYFHYYYCCCCFYYRYYYYYYHCNEFIYMYLFTEAYSEYRQIFGLWICLWLLVIFAKALSGMLGLVLNMLIIYLFYLIYHLFTYYFVYLFIFFIY